MKIGGLCSGMALGGWLGAGLIASWGGDWAAAIDRAAWGTLLLGTLWLLTRLQK
jgi:hypothetical protein